MTLPIHLDALPPYRDDLERFGLEIETDPSALKCAVGTDHQGRPASIRFDHGDLRVMVGVVGEWPLSVLGPSDVVRLMRDLAGDAQENDRTDSCSAAAVARHASLALALHEAEHGRLPDDLRDEVETCLEEDGTIAFWVGGPDDPTRLHPDVELLKEFAGPMRIPFHAYQLARDDDGYEAIHVGPSISDQEGIVVSAEALDAVETLRVHAALAGRSR